MKRPQKISPVMTRNLLVLARAYGKIAGIGLSYTGQIIAMDQEFFTRLCDKPGAGKRPASFTVRKYDDVVAEFFKRWPKGHKFPVLKNPS